MRKNICLVLFLWLFVGVVHAETLSIKEAQKIADPIVLLSQFNGVSKFEDPTDDFIEEAILKNDAYIAYTVGLITVSQQEYKERAKNKVQYLENLETIDGYTKELAEKVAYQCFGRKVAFKTLAENDFVGVDGLGGPDYNSRVKSVKQQGDLYVILGDVMFDGEESVGSFQLTVKANPNAPHGYEAIRFKVNQKR